MSIKSTFVFLFIVLFFSCQKTENTSSKSSFIELPFTNEVVDNEEVNILTYLYYYNGAGVAVADLVGDELPDVFLVSNTGDNQLLENKGAFVFENVSKKANIQGKATWQTGTAVVDINGDQLNDIFVCSVSGIHGFTGHNEVYINQGDGTFLESAEKLGLATQDYSTAIAFLDFDLDGDLDIYLLNHAVHTEDGYRFPADKVRAMTSEHAGDRLFRNDGEKFTDVSKEAGLIRSKVSYGLAVKISDLNKDGWPDIYVSNDFHENDYIYMNQGDGTFLMQTKALLSLNTKYSMGNDIADVNNDGWPDIFVADMAPWNEAVKKTTQGEDSPETFAYKQNFGYLRQYTRNTLQLNQAGKGFTDVAQLYNLHATDWSWSPILDDFNHDGLIDLFVSNGILRRPNDLDFLNYISSSEIQNKIKDNGRYDLELIDKMPKGLVPNQFFLQTESGFSNQSTQIGFTAYDSSTGTATADFDNDGDLDLVISRLNQPAIIWQNNLAKTGESLTVKFYNETNAYGAKLQLQFANKVLYREFYPQRGFMSNSQPLVHFGYPKNSQPNSLIVNWANGSEETITLDEGVKDLTLFAPKSIGKKPQAKPVEAKKNYPVFDSKQFTENPLLPFKKLKNMNINLSQGNIQVDSSPFQPLTISINNQPISHNAPKSLWFSAAIFDKDLDGDLDILLGSLGNNHRLKATKQSPVRLYQSDFDKNGSIDSLWAVKIEGKYFPLYDKDAITKQFVFLKKKYPTYQSFANQTIEEIFDLTDDEVVFTEIESFENGWLIQKDGIFIWEPLPLHLQQGPITSITKTANDKYKVNGFLDIFVPYIGLLETTDYVWNDEEWIKN